MDIFHLDIPEQLIIHISLLLNEEEHTEKESFDMNHDLLNLNFPDEGFHITDLDVTEQLITPALNSQLELILSNEEEGPQKEDKTEDSSQG